MLPDPSPALLPLGVRTQVVPLLGPAPQAALSRASTALACAQRSR